MLDHQSLFPQRCRSLDRIGLTARRCPDEDIAVLGLCRFGLLSAEDLDNGIDVHPKAGCRNIIAEFGKQIVIATAGKHLLPIAG